MIMPFLLMPNENITLSDASVENLHMVKSDEDAYWPSNLSPFTVDWEDY